MKIQSPFPTVRRSFVIVAVAGLLAGLLAGLFTAYASAAQSSPPVTDGPVVELRDNLFHSARLEVPAGTTVTWWWNDGGFGGHDLRSAAFAVPEQTSGTFAHRFATPGSYQYLCSLHDGMTGTIVVRAAGTPTP